MADRVRLCQVGLHRCQMCVIYQRLRLYANAIAMRASQARLLRRIKVSSPVGNQQPRTHGNIDV